MNEYIIKLNRENLQKETDGYAKQYIYALAVYFIKMVSLTSEIITDREIGAAGNRKDVVDGINTIDKSYIYIK